MWNWINCTKIFQANQYIDIVNHIYCIFENFPAIAKHLRFSLNINISHYSLSWWIFSNKTLEKTFVQILLRCAKHGRDLLSSERTVSFYPHVTSFSHNFTIHVLFLCATSLYLQRLQFLQSDCQFTNWYEFCNILLGPILSDLFTHALAPKCAINV